MKTTTIVAIIIVLVVLAGGWYWWSSTQPAAPVTTGQENTTSSSSSAYVAGNLLLGTDATTTLGTYLIASNGMTLYTYSKDSSGTSTCSGQCAVVWPPYTIDSADQLDNIQAGITGDVGSIVRTDGSTQVTYKGSPLYFYANDKVSGDVTGQNVGKVWFVVKP